MPDKSSRASATVEQIPVMTSTVDSSSSCLAFGCSSPGTGVISARISDAPLVSSRVSRSTSSSSHSMPRLERSDGWKGMCTHPGYGQQARTAALEPSPVHRTRLCAHLSDGVTRVVAQEPPIAEGEEQGGRDACDAPHDHGGVFAPQ